ncbi:MAG: tRNA (N(6)-L-threonylcarbamoyladenosine(37)-C(2))-methylthiotransferase MtaB [Bacteroidales bacterium]|nr:tRNA (N(6)-L-threonylcarbamoyladenosine(37)-C(2))-methylthiotransferase MtaB [Bacteroidales bacterium]
MKILFLTLGCKLNYAETSTYEREFIKEGFEVIGPRSKEQADVCLINTCAVTETAEKKDRNLIRKMHRQHPGAAIVVTGCYAELRKESIQKIEGVSLVFGAKQKTRVVKDTIAFLKGELLSEEDLQRKGLAEEYREISKDTLPAFSTGERTRSFLKVQDGCNNFCAYCTVPFARGESRNIPICEVVKQARAIAAEGVKEIVLTGVNTGDYGRTTGESFLDLLKALNEVDGIERYRISSIEPNLITEEIVDWIASGTKFQPHFHIPLQTGSDTLLHSMGRHYTTEFFASRIDYIRKAMEAEGKPKVFFGIDTMVGLPGETEELFMETYRFIESLHPAFVHIFPYSRRPGTRAAAMDGQVSEKVKEERVHRLEELSDRLHAEFIKANEGVHEKVLLESSEKDGMMAGYTGNYIRIERPFDGSLSGKIIDVVI